jgi:hypothetical protein
MAAAVSALFAGHTVSFATLLLALVFVALIGLVAKQRFDAYGRKPRPRDGVAMDERIRARLEATIWPD